MPVTIAWTLADVIEGRWELEVILGGPPPFDNYAALAWTDGRFEVTRITPTGGLAAGSTAFDGDLLGFATALLIAQYSAELEWRAYAEDGLGS